MPNSEKLTDLQARVLAAVSDDGRASMSIAIRSRTGLGQSLVRNTLNTLLKKGLVERTFHAAGCYTWWDLTDAGRATLPAEGCDSAAAAHSSSETDHV